MKTLLRLEEAALFGLAIYLFTLTDFAWWWFPALLLVPDLSMLGYLANARLGAWVYNFFHHKALAVIVLVLGYFLSHEVLTLAGIILLAHSTMDRMLGYGLKLEQGFRHTHLGLVGKENP